MAHFLKGKFRGLYPAGNSECVRDMFRFRKVSENQVKLEVTRRDAESLLKRFWRYENASINLIPVDENEPRLGGKVQAKSLVVDFRALTVSMNTQYGVYSDNFVTFATFDKAAGNPLDDEELLLKVMDADITGDAGLLDKTSFKFEGNSLYFSKEVNEERDDVDLNHPVDETKLDVVLDESWTEALFYGIGNKAM